MHLVGTSEMGLHLISVFINGCLPTTCFFFVAPCCAFVKYKKPTFVRECGVTDSLRTLLMHENFIKPYSEEQTLASLLTRAFS